MKKNIGLIGLLIPLIVALIFSLLNFVDFYTMIENKIFDLFLNIKPAVPEHESILLMNIDDTAIENLGIYPWPRDILADGLILMKEFNAEYAIFDIEYTENSPLGVNTSFEETTNVIEENTTNLINAIVAGQLTLDDALDFIPQLSEVVIDGIVKNNDDYFGNAARYFEKAYFTVNVTERIEEKISDELKILALEKIPVKSIDVQTDSHPSKVDIRPAIMQIIDNCEGAGFPLITVDTDGVLRKIDLLFEFKGKYFPQLAFSPLIDLLGNPEIELYDDKIVLKDAEVPVGRTGETELKDIVIPLSEDKRIIINWPKNLFEDSFRQLTFYELVFNKDLEEKLIEKLRAMQEAGFLNFYSGDASLFDSYDYTLNIKNEVLAGADPQNLTDFQYSETREYFFNEVGLFLTGNAEADLLNYIDSALQSPDIPEETKASYIEIKEEIPPLFQNTRDIYDNLMISRNILKEELLGSFVMIGWTGTSTTDIGVSPFEENYMNVGVHASLANTILSGEFLDELPWWYSAVLALILCFVITLIIRNLNPLPSIIVGSSFMVLLLAGAILMFIFTGLFIKPLTPMLSVFFTFISFSLFKFLQLEKEKSYIKNAFSHYLSADVINELITDPDKLVLGGEEKYLSAIFTDIRGFSSISEVLEATDLVKLLNHYLTEMSNIIMDQRGTIDKYEGDAIISFFGAPVSFEDHAKRACLSAVRMKKMEMILNKHFLESKISPAPLLTRIGVNTGNMVVGNMGTTKKMDYTIMGNAVNLAARLEGVNKQYGTWVLISEQTYKEGGADFAVKKLDRVRVVGIKEPVRLYELVDEKALVDDKTKEVISTFHSSLDLFENKEWKGALEGFEKVSKLSPDDGPTKIYLNRCKKNIKDPPRGSWDGVFNLRSI